MPVTDKLLVRAVDEDGISLWGFEDRVLDVLLDGRRVWSFWSVRDTEPGSLGRRRIEWPQVLRRFLDGHTRLEVREHVSGAVLYDRELALGTSAERIAVVGRTGAPMGLDKSGRMSATFDVRTETEVAPLLDAIEHVLAAIRTAGIEAFLGYGTLLGAVREQRFLGHDSDADLAYVSRWSTPVDVIRESFALQRAVHALGFATQRYSGAAFRIDVVEGDGVVRGLDVFAGFLDAGRLYLMGEVGADFSMDWIYPTSTVVLEGRELPAPAVPERLLEAMYGPSWQVPDPAFKFTTDPRTARQLTGWFRGSAGNRPMWERSYSRQRNAPSGPPSPLAKELRREHGAGVHVLDVGAGRGGDSLWLARKGARVTAYDLVPKAAAPALRAARSEGLDLSVRTLNLTEWRSVLGEGARAARLEGPRVMLARHLMDSTGPFARDSFARFASMALRGGGTLYADVWTGDDGVAARKLRPVSVAEVAERLERQGATIMRTRELAPGARQGRGRHSVGRLVAKWD